MLPQSTYTFTVPYKGNEIEYGIVPENVKDIKFVIFKPPSVKVHPLDTIVALDGE